MDRRGGEAGEGDRRDRDQAREIVAERAIYLRERMVNLGLVNYVFSKYILLAVFCVLAGMVLIGGYFASQTVYFVGTDRDGFVTLYRGLPYELPGGVKLYTENFVSGVNARRRSPSTSVLLSCVPARSWAESRMTIACA